MIRIGGPDESDVERAALRLRDELRTLAVDDVSPVASGQAPDGTRAPSVADVGALLVSLGPSVQLLTTLVRTTRDWLARGTTPHTVRLTIDGDALELGAATSEQQDRLVDEWVRTHGLPAPTP